MQKHTHSLKKYISLYCLALSFIVSFMIIGVVFSAYFLVGHIGDLSFFFAMTGLFILPVTITSSIAASFLYNRLMIFVDEFNDIIANFPQETKISNKSLFSEYKYLIENHNKLLAYLNKREDKINLINKKLTKVKEVAYSAQKSKSYFLANMSHELRTPLNAIINFSEIQTRQLLGPMENKKYLEYSYDINNAGKNLLYLINDLLDLSKAEAGLINLNFVRVDIEKLLFQINHLIKPFAKDKTIFIEQNIDKDLPGLVCDKERLKQILWNLLINAVNSTPQNSKIIFKISNNVKDANLTFSIIDNSFKLKQESSKYGLAIPLAKKLTALLGGELEIKNIENFGRNINVIFKGKLLDYSLTRKNLSNAEPPYKVEEEFLHMAS